MKARDARTFAVPGIGHLPGVYARRRPSGCPRDLSRCKRFSGQATRRYFATASGAKTASMAAPHSTAFTTAVVVGPPSINARVASTTLVTGWFFANAYSQPGIVSTRTNADEANVNGKRIGNAMSCAVSPLGADMPMIAKPHESAYANSSTTPIPAR